LKSSVKIKLVIRYSPQPSKRRRHFYRTPAGHKTRTTALEEAWTLLDHQKGTGFFRDEDLLGRKDWNNMYDVQLIWLPCNLNWYWKQQTSDVFRIGGVSVPLESPALRKEIQFIFYYWFRDVTSSLIEKFLQSMKPIISSISSTISLERLFWQKEATQFSDTIIILLLLIL
jgi:hypothetical protein